MYETSRNLSVLFDHEIFAAQSYGGISRYILQIARILSDMPGIKVRIFAGLHHNHYLARNPAAPFTGIYCPPFPHTVRLRRALNTAWLKALLRRQRPDVLHQTYYAPLNHIPANLPVTVTIHDLIEEQLSQLFPADWPTRHRRRAAIDRADGYVCVSQATKAAFLASYRTPGRPLIVAPHGCTPLRPTPESRKHLANVTGRTPFLLFVGVRGGYKNYLPIVQALSLPGAMPPELRLVFFGGNRISPAEQHVFQKLKITPGRLLRLSGGDALLGACYEKAAALVYPSLCEGFGMPILEALHAGCPVACSDIAVFREVAEPAAVFFDPHEPAAIASAVMAAIKFRKDDVAWLSIAREVLSRFSWERSAELHAELYKTLAGI